MSQLQDLARCLLAAGYASHADGQGMHLLSTDEGNLISKDWTGGSFGKEELIATSIRPDSSAAILVTPDDNVIIGITAASTLAAFQFDEDEEEWVQDRALSAYTVHAKGKLSACHTSDQRVCIVFQDVRGALVRVEENDSDDASESSDGGSGWITTVLEKACEPMLGTPITLMLDESGLHVFYVSEADKRIHRLREGGPWADEDIAEHAFGPLQALAVSRGSEDAALTTYALTMEGVVLEVSGGQGGHELGRIDKHQKLIPSTSAECCFCLIPFIMIHIHVHVQRRRRRICW